MAKKIRNQCKNSAKLCRTGNPGERKLHCKSLATHCISPAARKRAASKLKKIHAEAHKIWKKGSGKYTTAVKQASKSLKNK